MYISSSPVYNIYLYINIYFFYACIPQLCLFCYLHVVLPIYISLDIILYSDTGRVKIISLYSDTICNL